MAIDNVGIAASTCKTCKKCGEEKNIELFGNAKNNKDGHRGVCKVCVAKYYKEYCSINSERVSKYSKEYRNANIEKSSAYIKEYQKANREVIGEYKREWIKKKRNTDPTFKLLCNLRRRINKAISGEVKSAATKQLIGCTVEEMKEHLEKQFTSGMNWGNYGEWHVDHIMPCISFDLSQEKEQRECFNYRNLQPLWAVDNLKKSGNYTWSIENAPLKG